MVHGGGHHRGGGGVGNGGSRGVAVSNSTSSRRVTAPVRYNHGSGHHNNNIRVVGVDNNRNSNISNNMSWWGQRHYQQPPVAVVYPHHSTTFIDRHNVRQQHEGNDDCCEHDCCACCCNLCCQALCLGMLCRVCCSSSNSSGQQQESSSSNNRNATSSTSNNGNNNEQMTRPRGCRCCHGLGTFLSIFLLLILIAASGMKNDWTMNAGETRRIQPSFFTKSVTITATGSSSSGSSSTTNIKVYDLLSCPALTGPMITIQDSQTLTLGTGDYQYDYFYLNAGSTIQLQVTQQKGTNAATSATKVFILQGQDKLNDLENGNADNQDADDFARNALVQRYISGAGASASLLYRVKTTDVYILVYDNVSSSSLYYSTTNIIDVDYQVSLTSFDLSNQTPTCQEDDETAAEGRTHHDYHHQSSSLQECVVDYRSGSSKLHGGCIIVQATSTGGGSGNGEAIVHVQITGQRQWILVFFCASLPFFICLFMTQYYYHHQRRQFNTDGYEPVPPPPTAPHYSNIVDNESIPPSPAAPPQPSAPPEEALESSPYSSGVDPIFNPMAPTTAAVVTPMFAEAHILVDQQQDFSSIPIVSAENVVAIPAEKVI